MSDEFNPYHKWLGIPLNQQPANHYRLLGLEQGECDPDVIAHAAEQRIMHLKSIPTGPYGDLSRSLVDEISRACNCLLDSGQKTAYDTLLQSQQNSTPFTTSPRPHSATAPEWPPRDSSENKIDGACDYPFFNEDNSSPLPIRIDTGSPPQIHTNSDRSENTNKAWEALDTKHGDLPVNSPTAPDFTNVSREEKQEQIVPPEPPPVEKVDASAEMNHVGIPMPPPFPPAPHVEVPPAIGPLTNNAPAFPEPPPLPPTKNTSDTQFEPQENPPAWPAPHAPKDETKFPPWIGPPPFHPLDPLDDTENTPGEPDSFGNGPDAGEPAGDDIFGPANSTGTLQSKNPLGKANRKKEKRIQLIGHLLAPIIGLILGWIILQYLKTK